MRSSAPFPSHEDNVRQHRFGPTVAAWLGPDDFYCHVVRGASRNSIVYAHPRLGDIREIFSTTEQIGSLHYGAGQHRVRFNVDKLLYEISGDGAVAEVNLDEQPKLLRQRRWVGEEDLFEIFSPDKKLIALMEDTSLKIMTGNRGETLLEVKCAERQTWELGSADWSPDGKMLALPKLDYENVPRTPVTSWLVPRETVRFVPETRTGEEYPVPSLSICHMDGRVIDVELLLEGASILIPIGWTIDHSEYLFLQTNRTMNVLQVYAADPMSGRVRLVLREESPTFIEGLRLYEIARHLLFQLEDSRHFIWLSERNGWHGLWLYGHDAREERLITPPGLEVLRVLRQAPGTDLVFFLAHERQRPYDTHLFEVSMGTGTIRRLSRRDGQHHIDLSPSCEFYFDQHASLHRDPATDLYTAHGEHVRNMDSTGSTETEEQGSPDVKAWEVSAKAADGITDLWGVLVLPSDFTEGNRYPVIDFIYNGPFVTWAPRTRHEVANGFPNILAKAGFAVLILDGRGTPERGKRFQDVVYRAFGRNEVDDHYAALKSLCHRHGFLDMDRVGICGGSWGGYMTIRAMLRYPDFYKTGVATNPVHDLIDHSASAIEPYMGLPDQNPDGYKDASNLALADSLKGKLLIMHGTSDRNAPLIGTMKMVAKLMQHDKDFDLKLFPDQNHAFDGPLQSYWIRHIISYFRLHL